MGSGRVGQGKGSRKDLRKGRDLKRDWEGTKKAKRQEVGHLVAHFRKPTLKDFPPETSQPHLSPLYCFKALF